MFPTPPQREVLATGLLTSGFDVLLQMPTGAGKTWLAEHAIADTLAAGRRAIYLTPLRALAAELAERWRPRFAPHEVGVFTGEVRATASAFASARLLVMTPERLDACTRHWGSHFPWLAETDLLVVDEFHLLGDHRRGPGLEGALLRIRRLNPFLRLLGLSATLGNRDELSDWLGAVEYASDWRPVPLRWRVERYARADEKLALLERVLGEGGGRSLVFVQSRRRAEEVCAQLVAAGLRVAHHHAGLDSDDRRAAETAFRTGVVEILVATATLEMGLNLPARRVVLYDLQAFTGDDFRPLACTAVWQRAGRAGRPGLDTEGEVVLLAAAWDRSATAYAAGRFEPVRSGLARSAALAGQLVVEVASGLCRSVPQLRRAYSASLAAHQGVLPDVAGTTRAMVAVGMLVESEEGRLRATRLGRIATRHFLAPETLVCWRRVLDAGCKLTFFDLLLLATSAAECEPLLPASFEELPELAAILSAEPSTLLARSPGDLTALLGIRGKRLLAALKTAHAVRGWTRTGDAVAVAEVADGYPTEIERLRETMGRLLGALACVVEPAPERLTLLRRMVAGGLDAEAASLTLLPGLGPKTARRLVDAGFSGMSALRRAVPSDLAGVRGLSSTRATRWIATARAHPAIPRDATGPRTHLSAEPPTEEVDPYRLRRARELTVVPGTDGGFLVHGGQEPHRVQPRDGVLTCDCRDAAVGFVCKHLLAVRLRDGDTPGTHGVTSDTLNLFELWHEYVAEAAP